MGVLARTNIKSPNEIAIDKGIHEARSPVHTVGMKAAGEVKAGAENFGIAGIVSINRPMSSGADPIVHDPPKCQAPHTWAILRLENSVQATKRQARAHHCSQEA